MYDFLHDFFFFCLCFIQCDFIAHLSFLRLLPLTTHQLLFPTVLFFYLFCIFLLLLFVDMLDPLFGSFNFFTQVFFRFDLYLFLFVCNFARVSAIGSFSFFLLVFFCVSFSCLVLSCLLIQQKS